MCYFIPAYQSKNVKSPECFASPSQFQIFLMLSYPMTKYLLFSVSLYLNICLCIPFQSTYLELKFYKTSALKLILPQYYLEESIHDDVLGLFIIALY